MTDFAKFEEAVALQFSVMAPHGLYRVDVETELLWLTYLEAFPPGTNEVFRKRREFDCSCCRHFVKAMGGVISIIDGLMVSIWDIKPTGNPAFDAVAGAMVTLVKQCPISNLYLTPEHRVGTEKSFDQTMDRETITWRHFFVDIPTRYRSRGDEIGPKSAEWREDFNVLKRSLKELKYEDVMTVLDLISQNSLYRGSEHQHTLQKFRELKLQTDEMQGEGASPAWLDLFVWSTITIVPKPVCRIRNTSIGTLLVNLAEGMDLDAAVGKYEAVVAPQNYKRPTALVTPKMIEAAKAKIEELGLLSALERRYARLSDITITDILFANREARKSITGDVFDTLATKAPKISDKITEISIGDFIATVLPRVTRLEVLLENRHAGNLVSLIAPANPTAYSMFKWSNRFSWSYTGDVADSIAERVKKAGGSVTGDLLCRLAWNNYDDLDLHMVEPNGHIIFYRQKQSPFTGGQLDVDMNAGSGMTRTPVENIFYRDRKNMLEGTYSLRVHQFNKREDKDVGFEVEVDWLGQLYRFAHPKVLSHSVVAEVVRFTYTHANGVVITAAMPHNQVSRELWGLNTQQFHPVTVLTTSPNYWGANHVGNKHYFFMLDGCRNDGQARGFYNEFLNNELNQHGKVIEMVGAKMKTERAQEQLSGLGFSDTKRADITVKVEGSFTRILKINF